VCIASFCFPSVPTAEILQEITSCVGPASGLGLLGTTMTPRAHVLHFVHKLAYQTSHAHLLSSDVCCRGDYGSDSGGECGVPFLSRFFLPNNRLWYSYNMGSVHFTVTSSVRRSSAVFYRIFCRICFCFVVLTFED
jgi:hypothetical protein